MIAENVLPALMDFIVPMMVDFAVMVETDFDSGYHFGVKIIVVLFDMP